MIIDLLQQLEFVYFPFSCSFRFQPSPNPRAQSLIILFPSHIPFPLSPALPFFFFTLATAPGDEVVNPHRCRHHDLYTMIIMFVITKNSVIPNIITIVLIHHQHYLDLYTYHNLYLLFVITFMLTMILCLVIIMLRI